MQCFNCGAPIYGSSDSCSQCGTKGSPFTITAASGPRPAGGALPPEVPDHLILAVLATVMFCMPLGIVALVYANQVQARRLAGDFQGALLASRKARSWSIAAIVSFAAVVLLTLAAVLAAALM